MTEQLIAKHRNELNCKYWDGVQESFPNAKRQLLGVHHSVGNGFLQNYLNEFIYKLNRRNFTHRYSFDGLMTIATNSTW